MDWFSWSDLAALFDKSFVLSILALLSFVMWTIAIITISNHMELKKKGIKNLHKSEISEFQIMAEKKPSRRIKNRTLRSFSLHCQKRHYWGVETILLLSAIAPLLGLLGTVEGMITTFNALAHTGVTDTTQLTKGISSALVTTQAGLLVAISGVFAGGVLQRKEKKFYQQIRMLMS